MTPDPDLGESLPADWSCLPLAEVVDVLDSRRKPLNSEERSRLQGPYPYYGANGVVDHVSDWIFDEPLLLMAEDGGYFDEYETRPIAYLVNGRCWVNNHAHVLRVRNSYDLRWVHYSLVHRDIRPFINSGTRSKLNQADLRRIPVPLPPLPEQRKIAAILSSVDEAIEGTQAVIDQLQVVKKAMMADLFTRGIPGRHKKFKMTEIGEVPDEWEVASLGSLASFVTSGSRGWAEYYATEGALFIRSQNVRAGILDFSDRAFVRVPAGAEGERTKVAASDVLITITGNSVGNVAEAPGGLGAAYVSQHVGLARLRESSSASFVAMYLSPGAPGNVQVLAAQYGQSKPGLSLANVRSFLVPIPSAAEMLSIQEVVASVQDRITSEERALENIRIVKQSLMSVLLTGEVRVRVDAEAEA
jgi:type I restriction enzyme S subunit